MAVILAYVEDALPATGRGDRETLAASLDLALEVANVGGVTHPRRVPVVTIQAFGMHDAHPLHPDPEQRERGAAHLRETIELAARWRVPRVLAVCGYGETVVSDPLESCRAFFEDVAPLARERGVRILLEPLSPLRAAAMTSPEEFDRLLTALDAPDVFSSVLDLGHLIDAGLDPREVLAFWRHPVEELQLRGAASRPPPADLPLAELLALLPRPPDVVCVEHREPIAPDALAPLVAHLRAQLAR